VRVRKEKSDTFFT